MTTVAASPRLTGRAADLAGQLIRWFETGVRQDGMFAADLFVDLSLPHWRVQTLGDDAAYRLRADEHPFVGELEVEALERTERGFLVQFEERWQAEGQRWYCRELLYAVIAGGAIAELVVYCTGDWDEAVQRRHADRVQLLRP